MTQRMAKHYCPSFLEISKTDLHQVVTQRVVLGRQSKVISSGHSRMRYTRLGSQKVAIVAHKLLASKLRGIFQSPGRSTTDGRWVLGIQSPEPVALSSESHPTTAVFTLKVSGIALVCASSLVSFVGCASCILSS